MISLHLQGHITPFVDLCLKIASKGFSVTFVHHEFIHHMLSKSHNRNHEFNFFSKACESGLDIRYKTISDGFPVEFDRFRLREEYMEYMLREFPARVDCFVGKIIESDPNTATFLVADTLYSWPETIAKKYNLVNVSFWTQPALVFSLDYHFELLRENGHFPCKGTEPDPQNYKQELDATLYSAEVLPLWNGLGVQHHQGMEGCRLPKVDNRESLQHLAYLHIISLRLLGKGGYHGNVYAKRNTEPPHLHSVLITTIISNRSKMTPSKDPALTMRDFATMSFNSLYSTFISLFLLEGLKGMAERENVTFIPPLLRKEPEKLFSPSASNLNSSANIFCEINTFHTPTVLKTAPSTTYASAQN
ncbi:hypothetical protein F511_32773 [Dorcoceras hygrometricum]|uniref:Uncharacterized protein n=1 Tax=Dorcoceras hygrometricum TaxID=472368 RepID=A0A2Z7C3M3_9LAMI|nr:hypothetical protein F511_32773 [Dorcoceras hygrometricum]